MAYVKHALLKDLKSSGKIHIVGGDNNTSTDQVRLFRYDEAFKEDLEFSDNTVFCQGQKDILAKLIHNYVVSNFSLLQFSIKICHSLSPSFNL